MMMMITMVELLQRSSFDGWGDCKAKDKIKSVCQNDCTLPHHTHAIESDGSHVVNLLKLSTPNTITRTFP
jgi:hypothetical protein